jgi:hypothetical protein
MHGNVDPKLLYSTIKYVQDSKILPTIGTALFIRLQNLIVSDNTGATWPAEYKTLLDIYIIDALIWSILCELPLDISYQFWNKGIVRKQGLDTDLPSMSDLFDIGNHYKTKAEFYLTRLKDYLKQTATLSVLPEYINPGTGIDTMIPDNRTFTSPIYLGPDNDCCCNDTPIKPYGQ